MLERQQIVGFLADGAITEEYILPVSLTQIGSRAYGLSIDSSDYDFVGTHMMSAEESLMHPDFRHNCQVLRKRFDSNLQEIPDGIKGGEVSLDSFELWKFISLWLKGAPVIHELLYMTDETPAPWGKEIFPIMKEGITNRIGRAAYGIIMHDWKKHKTDRKKTVMAYYRALQAIHFLREGKFEWRNDALWDFAGSSISCPGGASTLKLYRQPETRQTLLEDKELRIVSNELINLLDLVDRAMVATVLPDQVEATILNKVLLLNQQTRLALV